MWEVQHTIQALSICVYTCQVNNSKSINIKIKVAPNPYSNYIEQGWLAHLDWPCKKGHDKTTGGLHIDGVAPMHWDKYDITYTILKGLLDKWYRKHQH